MDTIILNSIEKIVTSRPEITKVFLLQRAKFEGWLKFELAAELAKQQGIGDVRVESKIDESKKTRCDISFKSEEETYYVELKTCNASWKAEGVEHHIRPITKNIKSVIDDVKKLKKLPPDRGIVAFTLFPIPQDGKGWERHIKRIEDETSISLAGKREIIPLKKKCDMFVYAFRTNPE